ncbi:MAG: hypothetical protein ACTSUO_03865 [Candidatus Thorarchaeota archaeon]
MTMMRYPSYDEKRSERPVRLEKTEGTVVIEGRAYPAREIIEALAQTGYSEIRSSGDALILGRKRISPIFKSSKERAMAALCHESLAYCCPLTKRCAERDRALEIMGLTKEDYNYMKGNEHHQFMDMTRAEMHQDTPHPNLAMSRTANQPATDRGFGSDDYRRDFDSIDQAMHARRHHSQPLDGSLSWDRERESQRPSHRDHTYPERQSGNPFTDVAMDGSIIDTMRSSSRDTPSSGVCKLKTDPDTEGIGALFSQGELSPFKEEEPQDSLSFCFSCGRTFNPGTKLCPYCGARQ